MNNIQLYASYAQWGIFFLIVISNLLIGFIRGTKKTFYYTTVSIALTLVLMWGISFVTFRWIFRSSGILIHFIESFGLSLPEAIRDILVNPNLSPILFALLDVVLKIILFIILYPLVKWLLTKLVFKPVYKTTMGRNDKKQKINLVSRFGGAFIGAFRGVFITIVLLMPLLVIAGALNQGDQRDTSNISASNNFLIDTSGNNTVDEPSELQEYLRIAQSFHNEGIGAVTSKIKINGKGIDYALFDLIFTSTIENSEGVKTKFKLSEELNAHGRVAQILIEEGYLDEGFDYKTINHDDHYEDIDEILTSISNSQLINLLVPIALDILYENGMLEDNLGYDIKEVDHANAAFEELRTLVWKDEIGVLSNTIEQVLLLGSVSELLEMAENPNSFLELSQQEKQKVAHVLNQISKLQLLKATNIVVELLLQDEDVLNRITWEDDSYEYLVEQLDFILSNTSFLNNELKNISEFVLGVFSDEFEDFDYSVFMDGENFNLSAVLDEESTEIISTIITGVADLETVVKGIPLIIDYVLYTNSNQTIAELAEELSDAAKDQDYEAEINNIDDIYRLIVELGVEGYLDNEQDKLLVTDQLFKTPGNFNTVKELVNSTFEGSKAVNDILDIAGESLILSLVEDQDLLNVILLVISNDDFKYGTEVVNLLTIAEHFYKFSDITTIKNQLDNNEYVDILKSLTDLNEAEFGEFKATILNLQTLKYAAPEAMHLVKGMANIEQLIIPQTASYDSISNDLHLILDLVYELAVTAKNNNIDDTNYKSVNLARTLNLEKFKTLLLFDLEKDEHSMVTNSLVNFIQSQNIELGSIGTIQLPVELSGELNQAWIDELNNIVQGSFNLLDAFSGPQEQFVLSIDNLTNVKGLNNIPTHALTRFKDEQLVNDSFGRLLSSKIIHHNSVSLGENFLTSRGAPITLISPELEAALTNGANLVELINIAAHFVDEVANNTNDSLNTTFKLINKDTAISILNNLTDDTLTRLSTNAITNTAFRDALAHDYIHNLAYNQLSSLSGLPVQLQGINDGIFEFDYALDDNNKIHEETLLQILTFAKGLELPNNLLTLSSNEIYREIDLRINENKIDELLDVKLIHEVLSNVLLLDEIYDLGENYFSQLTSTASNANINITLTYDTYYNTLVNALTENNLVDRNEIKLYYQTYSAATEAGFKVSAINAKQYNALAATLLENSIRYNKNTLELLSETALLRNLLGTLLTDDDVLNSVVDLINPRLVLNDNQIITLNATNIKIGNQFLDSNNALLSEPLYELLYAVANQDLDIINRRTITNLDLENLIDENDPKLRHLYNSAIIEDSLTRLITSNGVNNSILNLVNQQLSNLTTRLSITNRELTRNDFSLTFDLIDYEAATHIIDLILSLNITSLNELTSIRSIDDAARVLNVVQTRAQVDKLAEVDLLYYVFETLLTNDLLSDMLAEIVETKVLARLGNNITAPRAENFKVNAALINSREFSNLLLAAFGSGITPTSQFASPDLLKDLLNYNTVAGQNSRGIEHILNANIIYSSLDKALQNKEILNSVVNTINSQLSNRNINLVLDADKLVLPENLLDSEGRIKKSDFVNLIIAFTELNISSYSELSQVSSLDGVKSLITLNVFDKLLDVETLHYIIDRALQSETTRTFMASLLNNQLNSRGINIPPQNLLIPEHLLDINGYAPKEDLLVVFDAFHRTDTTSFNNISFNSPSDIAAVLPITIVDTLLGSNLIHGLIDHSIQSEGTREVLAQLINQEASKRNLNINVNKDQLVLPAISLNADGKIDKADLVSLVDVFYNLGIDSFSGISVSGPSNIEQILPIHLVNQLLDNKLFFEPINRLVLSEQFRVELSNFVNNELTKRNINFRVNSLDFEVPVRALNDGKLDKGELSYLFELVYELNVDSFSELSQLTNINKLKEVVTVAYVEQLLESEYIYHLLGFVPNTENVRQFGADNLNSRYVSRFSNSIRLDADFLSFVDYDAVNTTGSHINFIKKEEIIKLVELVHTVDDLNQFSGHNIYGLINAVTNYLLTENDGTVLIDQVLDSNIIFGIFDKALNAKENDQINDLLIAIVNGQLGKVGSVNLELTRDDEIFIYHDDTYVDGKISKDSIRDLVVGLNVIEVNNRLGISTITDSVDRNIDSDGNDDFDKMYSSMILQSIISNLLLNDKVLTSGSELLNNRQSRIVITNDLIEIPSEAVEDDLIKAKDIKDLLRSIKIMGITNFSTSQLNLNTVLDLEGRNYVSGRDDLDRVLDSIIVHGYIDRLIQSDALNDVVKDMASDMANRNVVNLDTKPENDMLDADGKFSKDEIRAAIVSIKLLELNGLSGFTLDKLLSLNNANDDLDIFLSSNYIRVMLSRVLVTESVKDSIATGGKFDRTELTLDYTQKDANNNLSKDEVKNLLIALDTLGITDFNNISLDNNTLKELTDPELDLVLASNYFYQIIDLTLKAQLDPSDIDPEAVETSGDHQGLIKKSEIKALIQLLDILEVEDPVDLNADNITIDQLDQVVGLESFLIDRLISNEITTIIDVPASSKVDGRVVNEELQNLVSALLILNDGNRLAAISSADTSGTTVYVDQLGNLLLLDSTIVDRLISSAVIDAIDAAVLVNLLVNDSKDVIRAELLLLHQALVDLSINEISGTINPDDIDFAKLLDLTDPATTTSVIVNRLIADSIATTLVLVPTTVVEDGFITKVEVHKLFLALDALEITKVAELKDDTDFIETMTFDLIIAANNVESILFRAQLSDQIINGSSLIVNNDVRETVGTVELITQDELVKLFSASKALDSSIETIDGLIAYIEETDNQILASKLAEMDPSNLSEILVDTITNKIS